LYDITVNKRQNNKIKINPHGMKGYNSFKINPKYAMSVHHEQHLKIVRQQQIEDDSLLGIVC
jgi:hypothetical protein